MNVLQLRVLMKFLLSAVQTVSASRSPASPVHKGTLGFSQQQDQLRQSHQVTPQPSTVYETSSTKEKHFLASKEIFDALYFFRIKKQVFVGRFSADVTLPQRSIGAEILAIDQQLRA